jgi:peroxiredoxin
MHTGRLFIPILIFFSLASFLNPVMAQENDDRGFLVETGQQAPDFTVFLDNGEKWTLSEQRGKVVMLQFTASWCGVCRKEMPYIEKDIHKVMPDDQFVVIGIDRDEPLSKVEKFKAQTGITYPLALDPGAAVFTLYAHERAGVTRNVIINQNGEIVFLTRLFDKEEFDHMVSVIKNLIQSDN